MRAAVDAVTTALGGAYDGAHVRQADKAEHQSNEKLLVPALSHRRLTQHLLALLPPQGAEGGGGAAAGAQGQAGGAQAKGRGQAEGEQEQAQAQAPPRPLYVATDAPSLVRGHCLPACFAAFTWRDFVPTLRQHAPAPEILIAEGEQAAAVAEGQEGGGGAAAAGAGDEYASCSPYWVTAVDTMLLQRARRIVYSDTSNVGRTVAVARRRELGPEPLRFLMSLGVMPPLPPNVSAAQLEAAWFKGNATATRPATPPGGAGASAWASMATAHLRRSTSRASLSSLLAAQDAPSDAASTPLARDKEVDLRAWGDTTVDTAALARLQQLVLRHDPEEHPGCEDEHASFEAGERGALRCESDV